MIKVWSQESIELFLVLVTQQIKANEAMEQVIYVLQEKYFYLKLPNLLAISCKLIGFVLQNIFQRHPYDIVVAVIYV